MPDPACPLDLAGTLPAAKSCWYLINSGLRELNCGAACADAGIVTMPVNKTVTRKKTERAVIALYAFIVNSNLDNPYALFCVFLNKISADLDKMQGRNDVNGGKPHKSITESHAHLALSIGTRTYVPE